MFFYASAFRYWPYGSDGCQTHGFQGFLTALASIHFLAAIAWDRYHQYCTSKWTPETEQKKKTNTVTKPDAYTFLPAHHT